MLKIIVSSLLMRGQSRSNRMPYYINNTHYSSFFPENAYSWWKHDHWFSVRSCLLQCAQSAGAYVTYIYIQEFVKGLTDLFISIYLATSKNLLSASLKLITFQIALRYWIRNVSYIYKRKWKQATHVRFDILVLEVECVFPDVDTDDGRMC